MFISGAVPSGFSFGRGGESCRDGLALDTGHVYKKPEGGKTQMPSQAGVLHCGRHSFLVTKVGYQGGVRRRFCPSFNRVAERGATWLKGVNTFKSGAVSGPRKSESGELLATNHTHTKKNHRMESHPEEGASTTSLCF